MDKKRIKIIIGYRDMLCIRKNLTLYSTMIIDEADLEKILPYFIREDIKEIEIFEYNKPLSDKGLTL